MEEIKFIMMVGLPGSGKSYWAGRLAKEHDAVIVSSDTIRGHLFGSEEVQGDPTEVFSIMEKSTITTLKLGHSVVYDATNINAKLRMRTVSQLKLLFGDTVKYECVVVLCSITGCKQRQNERDRKVPDAVIDRMAHSFQTPFYNEGWDDIQLVHNGPEQNVLREHERLNKTLHDNPHHRLSLGAHCTRALIEMNNLTFGKLEDRDREILATAAYNHDLGKRKCKVFTNRKGEASEVAHYYDHENVGAYLWLSGNEHRDWTTREMLTIAFLIQWHMIPYQLTTHDRAALEQWCMKRRHEPWVVEWMWLMHEADKAAH